MLAKGGGMIIIALLCIMSSLSPALAYRHIEQFKRYVDQESREFWGNFFSAKGIVENFNNLGDIFQVWRDTYSGTRCANYRECGAAKAKELLKVPAEPAVDEPEEEVEEDPTVLQVKNMRRQMDELDEYIESLELRGYSQEIIDSNRENVRKYRDALSQSIEIHSGRRDLQTTGTIADHYK